LLGRAAEVLRQLGDDVHNHLLAPAKHRGALLVFNVERRRLLQFAGREPSRRCSRGSSPFASRPAAGVSDAPVMRLALLSRTYGGSVDHLDADAEIGLPDLLPATVAA
jgi:hypothetical protein